MCGGELKNMFILSGTSNKLAGDWWRFLTCRIAFRLIIRVFHERLRCNYGQMFIQPGTAMGKDEGIVF